KEFTDLQDIVMNNGGWDQFVEDACRGSGTLGSQALWDEMIDASRDENQYNMSAGADFLEELMLFLESDDSAASVGFVVAVLTYLDQFPIPRVMNDFQDIPPYLGEFDLIENFTRFEGTGDFEAAYDAMTATGEWDNITTALDNLANNQRQFESIQTLMRNIAVLSISDHPEAIAEGLDAFIGPLLDEDFDNMTAFQRFLIRFVEMADRLEETDIQDTDGDEIPDRIVWEYEKVLDTPEGQAWTAKMQNDYPHVNTAFSAFNSLPENILNIVVDSTQDPAWNVTGEVLADFGEWLGHFSGGPAMDDFSSTYDEENSTHLMNLDDDMESIPDFMTFEHNMYTPMIGIKLDVWNSDETYPNSINFGVTQSNGQERHSVNLEKVSDDSDDRCDDWNCGSYVGILEIPVFKDQMWEFDDILDELKDSGVIRDSEGEDRFEMEMELLSLSMIVQMGLEGNDEIFTVSALGVLVESPQQSLMGEDITIRSQVYNGVGPVEGAEVEVAVLRISPKAGFDLLNDNGLIGSEDGDEDDDNGDDGDGDDEDYTFYCDNGNEIPDYEQYKINNEEDDCGDWSDETPYETYYPCAWGY
ncbi:MAG: low-density lipoprotein receptor class A repeat-containing protein, partial [Candidatus Thermoplasmatota archaeon]|nr:low-density lipoprotein receptor class A repeat-containing protein [Candidatus Thermoplasmatota archaeon]